MRRADRDQLAHLRSRVDLVDRTRRALAVAASDDEAVRAVAAALDAALPDVVTVRTFEHGPDLALDPDLRARLGAALAPAECLAVRGPATVVTPSSRQVDACTHLRDVDDPVSAVCVPVAHGREVFAALHWTGPVGHPLDATLVRALEVVAHLLGAELALRHEPGLDEPARTDPLTSVLNRRSTMQSIRRLVRDLVPFSLAVCDLDRFADYDAVHGHDVGDRALRLYAQALTRTVRPGDVVGRTAGDVFTVVFPGTSAIDAAHALERVREALVLDLSTGDLGPFTVSCGVSDSDQGDSIEAIVETAELAVALAKASGGNRVVVAGEQTTHLPGEPWT
ncbi:GGDEF domain-containing protein [Actinomarinicola tropica]|uniref:Diguanylate cyclase n=1 Tax=Actinomarinicola tropica TaxID=2789776 RepID=A0A5Q2RFN7_9ACTN|nr:GGDEF domain-containing protein [Actinomarinicola tropica]QGG94513.1 diguanylate cyclase [Actinomarinicola tropica]